MHADTYFICYVVYIKRAYGAAQQSNANGPNTMKQIYGTNREENTTNDVLLDHLLYISYERRPFLSLRATVSPAAERTLSDWGHNAARRNSLAQVLADKGLAELGCFRARAELDT